MGIYRQLTDVQAWVAPPSVFRCTRANVMSFAMSDETLRKPAARDGRFVLLHRHSEVPRDVTPLRLAADCREEPLGGRDDCGETGEWT